MSEAMDVVEAMDALAGDPLVQPAPTKRFFEVLLDCGGMVGVMAVNAVGAEAHEIVTKLTAGWDLVHLEIFDMERGTTKVWVNPAHVVMVGREVFTEEREEHPAPPLPPVPEGTRPHFDVV